MLDLINSLDAGWFWLILATCLCIVCFLLLSAGGEVAVYQPVPLVVEAGQEQTLKLSFTIRNGSARAVRVVGANDG